MSDYVLKVILSCKTEEQLESCRQWIKKCTIDHDDMWVRYSIRLDYEQAINEMLVYLNLKGELNGQRLD